MQAHIPENEEARLAALHRYKILDTPPEENFDHLAELAAHVCGTPMAMISLVDADRQWFKARVGLNETETPREIAICSHVIRQSDLFVVPDTLADERFANNPLVTDSPNIRFYAGMPLTNSDGHRLGTLCVADTVPRQLTDLQAEALRTLSRQVVAQMELRYTKEDLSHKMNTSRDVENALRESEEFKTRLIESSEDCIKVLDLDGHLLSMNAGGMRILEICDFDPLRNSLWLEFWQGEYAEAARKAVEAAKHGEVGRFRGFCPTMGGKPMWWDVVVNVIQDSEGKPEKLLAVSRDITEQYLSERTLKEIVEGTATATGRDFFRSMVQHISDALPVKVAFVTECANIEKTRARTLAFWNGVGFAEDVEYDVEATPCKAVFEGQTCFYSRELQKLFPADVALAELEVESYIGVPMHDSQGEIIGHIAVMDNEPMGQVPRGMDVLKIFSARAGAELERMRAEAELREAFSEIEKLKNRLHAENVYLQEEIRSGNNFDEIVGESPALLDILEQVERIAPTDSTVLILGETGTGKELIARAIHNSSKRKERPLVKVNCGAISAGLVESELFGHVKGAFTGAIEKRTGRFELAHDGTLFLDEVGELPLDTQVKLLRVLQEGEFEPVGSSKTVKVNVRIIAATNRNLEDEVKAGRFRADLYYRLNILPLHNPPLRERKADIPRLAMFFLSQFARQFGRQMNGIAQDTLDLMMNYHWPGNIRELQNLIERGVVLARSSELTIEPGLLTANQLMQQKSVDLPFTQVQTEGKNAPRNDNRQKESSSSLYDLRRQHILNVLNQTNWVIEGDNGAAKILNLHPNTLRSRLKKMDIHRPKA